MEIGFSKEVSNEQPKRNGSKLLVMKPRDKALIASSASERSSDDSDVRFKNSDPNEISQELSPASTELVLNRPIERTLSVPDHSNKLSIDHKIIQIGVQNLQEIENFNNLSLKHHLPVWQYTAYEVQSGAVWVSYSYQFGSDQLNRFVEKLSDHLQKSGISSNGIELQYKFESSLRNRLSREDLKSIRMNLKRLGYGGCNLENSLLTKGSELEKFYLKMQERFYTNITVQNLSGLIKSVSEFLIKYNYTDKSESNYSLPPFQIISRLENGDCRSNVLKMKPSVLDKRQENRGRFLVCLKSITGSMSSFIGSAIIRRKREIVPTDSSTPASMNIVRIPKTPHVKNLQSSYEYISFKDIKWKRLEGQPAPVNNNSKITRNRQEIIELAKKLLAERRPMAELKKALPITEGELSMLKQNNISDKEVRILR